jgi:hypothetical protein
MSVVYVSNQVSSINYNPLAAQYGTVVFASRGRSLNNLQLITNIIGALIQSTEHDYLAITGHRLESSIALAVWLQLHASAPILTMSDNRWNLTILNKADIRIESEQLRDLLQPRR